MKVNVQQSWFMYAVYIRKIFFPTKFTCIKNVMSQRRETLKKYSLCIPEYLCHWYNPNLENKGNLLNRGLENNLLVSGL